MIYKKGASIIAYIFWMIIGAVLAYVFLRKFICSWN